MISSAHLHLMVNHIPLLGMLFGTALLAFYFFQKNLQQIMLAALVTIFISALVALPTYYSGESAEDLVENQAHVSKVFLHEHEEAAEVTVWVLAAAGFLSFLSLLSIYFQKVNQTKNLCILTLVTSLVAIGFTARTANLGGKISHPELRETKNVNDKQIYDENKTNEKDDD